MFTTCSTLNYTSVEEVGQCRISLGPTTSTSEEKIYMFLIVHLISTFVKRLGSLNVFTRARLAPHIPANHLLPGLLQRLFFSYFSLCIEDRATSPSSNPTIMQFPGE